MVPDDQGKGQQALDNKTEGMAAQVNRNCFDRILHGNAILNFVKQF